MRLFHRDPLAELDELFHALHAGRRAELQAALGAALVQIDDELILRLRGERRVGPARTRRYHELKQLCHLPLAIYLAVDGRDAGLDAPARKHLTHLRKLTDATTTDLPHRDLDPEQRARQRPLLADSLACIDTLLADDPTPVATVTAYLRAQLPALQANFTDAARDQLTTMHTTFSAWARDMSQDEWAALQVVVATSHAARTGNLASQYFTVALGDSWQGRFTQEDVQLRRVLSSELTTDEPAALALLAAHGLDERIAVHFFSDAARLGRDVLADATEALLAQMFTVRPAPAPDAPPSACPHAPARTPPELARTDASTQELARSTPPKPRS